MRCFSLVFFLFLIFQSGYSQDSTRTNKTRHTVLLGFLGEGSKASLIYEHRFGFTKFSYITLATGFGRTKLDYLDSKQSISLHYLTIPVRGSINVGIDCYFIELGMGISNFFHVTRKSALPPFSTAYPIIGFRIQDNKQIQGCFRLFYCPPINHPDTWKSPRFNSFGISFGKSF